MSGRLLRPDDPDLIIINDLVSPDDGRRRTVAVDPDGDLLCTCTSWRWPCEHMVQFIQELEDVPPPSVRHMHPLAFSFDLGMSNYYEVPLFVHRMTRVRLDPVADYTLKVTVAPKPARSGAILSGMSPPVVGFIDERFEARMEIRTMIIDWLMPWATTIDRREWTLLQCQAPRHPDRLDVFWGNTSKSALLQAHNLLMHGMCTQCVEALASEVPDV